MHFWQLYSSLQSPDEVAAKQNPPVLEPAAACVRHNVVCTVTVELWSAVAGGGPNIYPRHPGVLGLIYHDTSAASYPNIWLLCSTGSNHITKINNGI